MRRSVLLFVIVAGSFVNAFSQNRYALVSFCPLSVDSKINDTNTSFTEAYLLRLDEGGSIDKIDRLTTAHTNDKEVNNCLSRWRFFEFTAGEHVYAYFRWDHGLGWTRIKLIGKKFAQSIIKD